MTSTSLLIATCFFIFQNFWRPIVTKPIFAAIAVIFLSTGMEWEISDPEEVEVTTTTKGRFSAEILFVREHALVMTSPSGRSESDLIGHRERLFIVKNKDVQSIKTPGTSHVAVGLLGGGCIGCFAGYALGCSKEVRQGQSDPLGCNALNEQADNAATYTVLGGAGGMLAGAIIGDALSTGDSLWVTPNQRNFTSLNALARYPYAEPEFLKGIGE
jgi:hypothetical protein